MTRAYTVHAPPDDDAPERIAFVKDGISWPALFVPILWILWHRLWLTFVGYLIFLLLIAWTGRLANDQIATILAIVGGILFALEANNIRRFSLARRGWRDIGSSFGKGIEEAEVRFFGRSKGSGSLAGSADDNGIAAARIASPHPARFGARSDERILGLFPEPER